MTGISTRMRRPGPSPVPDDDRPSRIILDHVTHRFGRTVALDDVSLEMTAGEFMVLLGPSGCGKSTLLRVIAGLIEPSEGRVIVGDRDVTSLSAKDRDLAMVFQSYALYPHLSVLRNVGFGLRARRIPRAEVEARSCAAAEQLGLSELLGRKPRELSGGQRQRVALARAMVREPGAFLMDEPLSNLDAQLRAATRIELSELHQALGTTFVYVTHDQVEAMTMATRIAVMNDGSVEQVGTPVEVHDRPASTFVAQFVGSPPMNLMSATIGSRSGRVRLSLGESEAALWEGDLESRQVMVGVRPEHFGPEDFRIEGQGGGLALQVTVRSVENLGSEEVAVCDHRGERLLWKGPRPIGVSPGDGLVLHVRSANICLFDEASGRRLVWVPDTPRAREPAEVATEGSLTSARRS